MLSHRFVAAAYDRNLKLHSVIIIAYARLHDHNAIRNDIHKAPCKCETSRSTNARTSLFEYNIIIL